MADGHTTTYWYNQFGQVVAEERASDPVIRYAYDKGGNLTQQIDRKGQKTRITYNRMGMPVSEKFYTAAGKLEDENQYEYNRGGQRVYAQNNKTGIVMEYNALGQVMSETRQIKSGTVDTSGNSYTLKYLYDMAGNMTQITYPEGSAGQVPSEIGTTAAVSTPLTVQYAYNNYNRLVGVGGFADGTIEDPAFGYTANGFLTEIRYNNHTNISITPDVVNRVEQIHVTYTGETTDTITANATLFNTSYDYDGANNVTFRTNNMTQYANSYLYDELHRLTQAKVEGTFVQECQGTEVVAEADFDEDASMHAVNSSEYEVKLDYNGNSVGVEFLNTTKVIRAEVKHFTGYVSELKHRIIKDGISVLKSTNNYIYTEINHDEWNLTLDLFGNLVITFNEPQEVRYLKIHSRYEERDENYAILNKATFGNYLADMVKVYQQKMKVC